MQHRIFIGIYFFIVCVYLNAQNSVPSWLTDTEIEYPHSRYIVATGEGRNRADAEAAAIASISLFFNTQTDVRNERIQEYNEAVVNDTTDFSGKTYIQENAVISSEADFLGVHFANPYYIESRQRWMALAYIDKAEASRTYEAKIMANMGSINALAVDAAGETEALYVCGLLFRAVKIAGITEEYIKTAAVIDSAQAQKYNTSLEQMRQIRSQYRTNRDRLSFAVRSSAEDSTNRIARKLQELLESSGYIIGRGNSACTITISLEMPEEQMGANIYIYPGISVCIEREEKSLFSYSKNYQRYGHRTLSGAYNRAFLAIEQDLEENFLTKLAAMIGG